MILDSLGNARRYAGVHPGLAKGLEWLAAHDVSALPAGKHPIDGDRLYLVVVRDAGKGRAGTRLETHRRYVDIQCTMTGADTIGWRHVKECGSVTERYDAERDIEFYGDEPASWVTVPAGHFAVFFPEDAHAPMGTDGAVHKAVVKVQVS